VVVPKKSEPPRGSVSASATASSPLRMAGSQRAFCSGVPNWAMASPTIDGSE